MKGFPAFRRVPFLSKHENSATRLMDLLTLMDVLVVMNKRP